MIEITKMKQLPNECLFFGYGSLMCADGLKHRGMDHIYTDEELLPAVAFGLKRTMSAEWVISPTKTHRYYGVHAATPDSTVFGVLIKIHSKQDLIALLDDEYASPVICDDKPMYTLWDISDLFKKDLSRSLPILTLLCKERADKPEFYAPGYLEYVYEHLPDSWKEEFLLTGGVKP